MTLDLTDEETAPRLGSWLVCSQSGSQTIDMGDTEMERYLGYLTRR
jgi:hypothetical protein